MKNETSPRILITRLSHIGDCVLTLPLANAIKQAFPSCFLAWAVESPSQHLLREVASIDHLIEVPKSWIKRPSAWRNLRREFKQLKFDVAIDPQGITKSALLAWISGAPKRIGARGRWGRELSPFLNNRLITTETSHLVDRSLELLSGLELEPSDFDGNHFELTITPSSLQKMAAELSAMNLTRYVVINPGASWPSKQWELDRFAAVASQVDKGFGLKSLITWAGDDELSMARTIVEASGGAALVAPKTSLMEMAALCAGAEFFVGCDTGPLHIACATGTPCVGLYGPTLPTESGAYGAQHVAVQARHHSGTCRERRSAANDAMREIDVPMVMDGISELVVRQRMDSVA